MCDYLNLIVTSLKLRSIYVKFSARNYIPRRSNSVTLISHKNVCFYGNLCSCIHCLNAFLSIRILPKLWIASSLIHFSSSSALSSLSLSIFLSRKAFLSMNGMSTVSEITEWFSASPFSSRIWRFKRSLLYSKERARFKMNGVEGRCFGGEVGGVGCICSAPILPPSLRLISGQLFETWSLHSPWLPSFLQASNCWPSEFSDLSTVWHLWLLTNGVPQRLTAGNSLPWYPTFFNVHTSSTSPCLPAELGNGAGRWLSISWGKAKSDVLCSSIDTSIGVFTKGDLFIFGSWSNLPQNCGVCGSAFLSVETLHILPLAMPRSANAAFAVQMNYFAIARSLCWPSDAGTLAAARFLRSVECFQSNKTVFVRLKDKSTLTNRITSKGAECTKVQLT